jgi:hypothetical protein
MALPVVKMDPALHCHYVQFGPARYRFHFHPRQGHHLTSSPTTTDQHFRSGLGLIRGLLVIDLLTEARLSNLRGILYRPVSGGDGLGVVSALAFHR